MYTDARTSGLKTENIEPSSKVAGYIDRSIASKVVGRKGDLLGAILMVVDEASTILGDRLLALEGDSIVRYYNIEKSSLSWIENECP